MPPDVTFGVSSMKRSIWQLHLHDYFCGQGNPAFLRTSGAKWLFISVTMFPKSKRWDQKFKIFTVCCFLYAIAFKITVPYKSETDFLQTSKRRKATFWVDAYFTQTDKAVFLWKTIDTESCTWHSISVACRKIKDMKNFVGVIQKEGLQSL